ncbi:hypothetical protein RA266_28940, partial [Pseudomonas syringae pv. tagetis]|uniref:hypothetical protein n=1 Tax=Pseudomonas syringae group genomosp. 7 TaxID=251699 RepID=UPI00376F8A80
WGVVFVLGVAFVGLGDGELVVGFFVGVRWRLGVFVVVCFGVVWVVLGLGMVVVWCGVFGVVLLAMVGVVF